MSESLIFEFYVLNDFECTGAQGDNTIVELGSAKGSTVLDAFANLKVKANQPEYYDTKRMMYFGLPVHTKVKQ